MFDESDLAVAEKAIVRHEADAPRERSACGFRHRLLSAGDEHVAAWAHVVDLDGTKPHYHKRSTELYYVLEGDGSIFLDGERSDLTKGSLVHIPPNVVHRAKGRMRVLVVGIPDIADDDIFYPEQNSM